MKTAREDFLDSVIITAVEGGIGYWSRVRNYRWSDDGPTSVEIMEDEEPTWHLVDRDVIRKGLRLIAQPESPINLHESYRQDIARASRANEGGDIDATLADIIVQCAVLGEVVYG